MAQHYSNPKRASEPHALPDIETFEITEESWNRGLCFLCPDDVNGVSAFDEEEHDRDHCGWYWQACSPGCLPDSDPSGPFATEEEALEDARAGMED